MLVAQRAMSLIKMMVEFFEKSSSREVYGLRARFRSSASALILSLLGSMLLV
jgi:hypothetical protein